MILNQLLSVTKVSRQYKEEFTSEKINYPNVATHSGTKHINTVSHIVLNFDDGNTNNSLKIIAKGSRWSNALFLKTLKERQKKKPQKIIGWNKKSSTVKQ